MKRKVRVEYKRIKNMYLRIDDDGTLHVTCPYRTKESTILRFIESKQDWIRKVDQNRERNRENQTELTGSTSDYAIIFDKKYPVQKIIDKRNYLEFKDGMLIYHIKKMDIDLMDTMFYKYVSQLMIKEVNYFKQTYDLHICLQNHKKIPTISYRYMKSRWGSCTPAKSSIRLNVRLVHYPIDCLNYVLLHEYAHLLVANHSKQFYDVVRAFMPNYKESEKRLSQL